MNSVEPVRHFTDPDALIVSEPAGSPRRAVFLDRDGVINLDLGYVHTAEQTRWVPGIFDFCRAARAAGFLLVIVTNQAGIARGLYEEECFLEYTRWMHEQFNAQGTPLAATYYCPHHPTAGVGAGLRDCACRKPKPGMLLAAAVALQLDLSLCILVGDTKSDLRAAADAGVGRYFQLKVEASGPPPTGNGQTFGSLPTLSEALGWQTFVNPGVP